MFSAVLVTTLALWLASTLLLIPFSKQVVKRRNSSPGTARSSG